MIHGIRLTQLTVNGFKVAEILPRNFLANKTTLETIPIEVFTYF